MFLIEKLPLKEVAHLFTGLRRLGHTFCLTCIATLAMTVSAQAQDADGTIEGSVQSSNGQEAGVWVIAETDDLPTHFIKIVVTDDEGRFMLPELPDALYEVWEIGRASCRERV